ncbi:MAG: hypothetical protein ACTSYX_03515, partial [Candidatus Thorarchaeota archaeon]
PVTVVAQGNGMYNISVSSGGLSIGDHWFIFNATKSGAYVNDASVNVTFTLRAHYTTASVSGDLTTPYGFDTSLTVTIIDTDTGQTVAIADVSSMTFTWSGGSHSEDPATSFDITLPTSSWAVGTKTVTLSVVMASDHYYTPDDYSFDVTIRNHYTSASVTGDLTTPWGFDTIVTIVIVDQDTGTELSYSDVSSVTFVTTHYGSQSPSVASSLTVQLDTDSWSVGDEAITLQVTMTGNYDNPSDYDFTITIRKHYTTASVQGDFVTPWDYDTTVTVIVTDQDTGGNLGTSDVSSVTFVTTHYGSQSPTISGSLTFTLSTDSWSVGDEGVTLQVGVDTTKYEAPSDYSFTVTIRNHYTSATVSGDLETPWDFNTDVTVTITDKDTGSTLAASSVSWVYFDYAHYSDENFTVSGSLSFTLSTRTWVVGNEPTTLKVSLLGDYNNPSDYDFTITIRNHHTSVAVSGDLTTPWGFNTTVTVVVTDTETGSTLSTSDVSWANFDYSTSGYTDENFTISGSLTLTLNTDSWSVGDESVTLSLAVKGDYYDPGDYDFTITIRKHYTSVSAGGDLVTPWDFDTTIKIMLVDEDTGNSLTQSDISSAILQTTHYGVKTLTVSSFMTATVATSTWAVGDEAVTLQVSVDSSKYQDPDNYGFTITIRNHHTSASVKGDFVTPWGLDTMATVVVVDEDTGSELGASDVAWANFDYAHYTDENFTISSSLSVTLNTDPWSVGTESITLTVGLNGDYDAPSIYSFSITIRNHYTTASVSGDLTTPWGLDTTVTVIVTDKDTGSTLGASDVSWANFDYATAGYTDENLTISGSLTLTLNTDPWAVGTESVTLTVGLNGDYDNPTTYSFSITIRNHYTAASVSGDLTTPWGYKTTVTVVITDQDTGAILGASAVSSVDFDYATSSYTDDHFVISGSLELTLNTDTWAVGTESVTMTVVMNGDYDAPASYGFSITIRRHYTSVTVTGSLTSPYGNTTPVTVVVTDLDTDTTLSASTVSSMVFDPTHYANQTVNPVTSLDIVLSTESWAVGTESVLIDVSMTANYYDPDDYTFTIEICALSTYLYHEPNDLIFPNGDSFKIIIRVNISEAGPYYGEMLTGLVAANFTVHNSTYNYPFTLQEISSGRFNLTIDGSYFPEGTYTITVEFNPVNATLDGSKLVITFQYRPARSELSSPDRAVTTPYDTDFDITLNFTDVDRNAGISGATITSEGISIYDVTDLGGGQYRVTVNVSGMTRGEYYYNITADKTGYEAQTIEFKVLIRAVYTSAIPTVNALDIPVGKDPVFNVDFTDLDHNVPIDDSAPFQLTCTWIHPIIWEYTTDNR